MFARWKASHQQLPDGQVLLELRPSRWFKKVTYAHLQITVKGDGWHPSPYLVGQYGLEFLSGVPSMRVAFPSGFEREGETLLPPNGRYLVEWEAYPFDRPVSTVVDRFDYSGPESLPDEEEVVDTGGEA